MLRKRIIFSLIYDNGYFNQSRNFRLQKVGNLTWLERNYKFGEIAFSLDELIILDVTRGKKNIESFALTVTKLVGDAFIPIAAGGGIRSLEDAELLFKSGADKIVLNSVLFENPKLVKELVDIFGAQSILASVDYKRNNSVNEVFISDATKRIPLSLEDYVEYLQELNVGEIYLNSVEKDGTGFGYDLETINKISKSIRVPLIIAGGAGNEKHLAEGLRINGVSGVATANLFNFIGNGLPNARKDIIDAGINIANWTN